MNLRFVLPLFFLLCADLCNAQDKVSYVEPEYKIRYRDTTGSFVQIINYYDRTYYTNNIFLKKVIDNGSAQYYAIAIDPETGIGKIPTGLNGKVNLQLAKTLEIEGIEFQKNKVHKVEIRNEGGFVSLPLNWGKTSYKKITGSLLNVYDSTSTQIAIPSITELSKGKYILTLNTIPRVRKTIYIKPSAIFYKPVYKSVPFQIANQQSYSDYKLYFSYYPYKKFKECIKGELGTPTFEVFLQPKKLYRLEYRKKGKRRYKKKKLYIDISMDVFIIELD